MNSQRLDELRRMPRCGDSTATSEANDFVDGLIDMVEYAKPRSVLEIGSDRGVSTEVFLLYCERVVAVDPWEQAPERGEIFQKNCGAYPNLMVVRGYSPDALSTLASESFDLVYIDADHVYNTVVSDVRASWPLVRSGGWISGHDYWPGHEDDVIAATHALFGVENIKVFADGSWLARRPDIIPDAPPAAGGEPWIIPRMT
jgi:predicted O-methyltransferase YrrM